MTQLYGVVTLLITVPRRLNGGLFPTKQVFNVDPNELEEADKPINIYCNNVSDFEKLIYE